MDYGQRVKDAKSALDAAIGRHGITVVLDALAEFAGEVTMQLTDLQRDEWWLINRLAAILADRTEKVLQGGISTEGR